MRRLYAQLLRWFSWIYFVGIWKYVRGSWAWTQNDAYRYYPLRNYRTLADVERALSSVKLKETKSRFGERVMRPGLVQWSLNQRRPLEDADDVAVYAAAAVRQAVQGAAPYVLVAVWLDGWKLDAGVTSAFTLEGKLYHLGSLFGGKSQGPYANDNEIAWSLPGKPDAILLCWLTLDAATLERRSFQFAE